MNQIAWASNVVQHTPQQQAAWNELEDQYRRSYNRALETGNIPPKRFLVDLRDALITYLKAIEVSDTIVAKIAQSTEVYLSGLP